MLFMPVSSFIISAEAEFQAPSWSGGGGGGGYRINNKEGNGEIIRNTFVKYFSYRYFRQESNQLTKKKKEETSYISVISQATIVSCLFK